MANESERGEVYCRDNSILTDNALSLRNNTGDFVQDSLVDEIKEHNAVKTTILCHQQHQQQYISRLLNECDSTENNSLIEKDMDSKTNTELTFVNEHSNTATCEPLVDSNVTLGANSPSFIDNEERFETDAGVEPQRSIYLQRETRTINAAPKKASSRTDKHGRFDRQYSIYPKSDLTSTELKKKRCNISLAKLSCCLSVITILGVIAKCLYDGYFNGVQSFPEEIKTEGNFVSETAALQGVLPNNSSKIVGRFILKSPFIVGHYITLHNAQEDEKTFQRRIKSVPVPENRHNPEYIPSSFISFVAMNAGGKICVSVSQYEYVYKSSLDNVINIFKM
ncbi:hypothetical protein ACF0H5_020508 [Mactra antiquata]